MVAVDATNEQGGLPVLVLNVHVYSTTDQEPGY